MNLPDILIAILLLLFALGGLRRGLVWELATAIGLLAGSALVYYYRAELVDLVLRLTQPGWQRHWGGSLLFLLVFLIVYLGFSVLGRHAHDGLAKTPFKWADRILGLAGGALKGAILIGLAVAMMDWMEGTVRVRHFLWDSEIIRWGKRTVYDVTHWESKQKRRWVLAENDERGTMNGGSDNMVGGGG